MAGKNTDAMVLELLRKVEEKKAAIKAASSKPVWRTNVTFGYNPESAERINIMTVTSTTRLAEIYAFLLGKEANFAQAQKELGLTGELLYMGYSFSDWKADLITRAGQLMLEQSKKELEVLDKRVNSLVSPEQRREMELEALQRELGG